MYCNKLIVVVILIIAIFINSAGVYGTVKQEIASSSSNGGEKPEKEGEPKPTPTPKKPGVKELMEKAKGLSGKGDYRGALKIYDDILKLDANNGVVYLAMAICYEKLKDYEKAEKNYIQSIRLAPSIGETHKALGDMYSRRGMYKEAITAYEEAVKLRPKDYGYLVTTSPQS